MSYTRQLYAVPDVVMSWALLPFATLVWPSLLYRCFELPTVIIVFNVLDLCSPVYAVRIAVCRCPLWPAVTAAWCPPCSFCLFNLPLPYLYQCSTDCAIWVVRLTLPSEQISFHRRYPMLRPPCGPIVYPRYAIGCRNLPEAFTRFRSSYLNQCNPYGKDLEEWKCGVRCIWAVCRTLG